MKIKIQKIEEYPNCRKITVSAMVNGKKVSERFSASPEQYENGSWKKVVKAWIKGLQIKTKGKKLAKGDEIEL